MCSQVFINDLTENMVDTLLRERPLKLGFHALKIKRRMDSAIHGYNSFSVTLRITQNDLSMNQRKLRSYESDLKTHFEKYGSIRDTKWINSAATCALFTFDE